MLLTISFDRLDLESVTAKLAIQQAKVAKMQQIGSSNLDEIITEKKIQQQLQLKLVCTELVYMYVYTFYVNLG